MDGYWLRSIILILLIILSGYFSSTETAVTSLNKIRLKNLASDGNKKAKYLLHVVDHYDNFLSAILIGNNIVNIAATTIATLLFTDLLGANGAAVSTVVMTVLVLIFGEITPKTLAKEAPESFALSTVGLLRMFLVIFTPLTLLFRGWKALVHCVFRTEEQAGISQDEILTIVEEAQQGGGINSEEGEMLRSVIEFQDRDARDILTPRVDMVAVDKSATHEEVAAIFKETGYSRLPVYDGNTDNIIGVLHQKDFFTDGEPVSINRILKKPVFVVPTVKISKLLRILQQNKTHLAIVTDEFGGTMGIVTMEDILEELVGDIWDEHDEVEEEEMTPIAENIYRVRCSMALDEFFDRLGLEPEEESDASTVGGWVLDQMNDIPEVGESFTYENLKVDVTAADERRVEEVRVTVLPKPEGDEEDDA